MRKIIFSILIALALPASANAGVFDIFGAGNGTIGGLDQWVSTTSPVSAITQRIFGKDIRITGLSSGCLQLDANLVVTSTGSACGSGSGGGSSNSKWATSSDSVSIEPNSAEGIIVNRATSTQATSTNLFSSVFTATSGFFTNLYIGAVDIAEYIADTAGAMFSSNTETGITVTYQDGDNTIDVVCNTADTNTFGCLTDTDWDTFNNKQNALGFTPANELTTLTIAGTSNQITSSAGAQDLSTNRTWTLSLPNHVIFPGNFRAGNATTTNATSTNLDITGLFTFNGVTGNSWDDFCTTITGSADLCDGDDAAGGEGGGANSKWATSTGSDITPNGGGGIIVSASSTISDLLLARGTTTNYLNFAQATPPSSPGSGFTRLFAYQDVDRTRLATINGSDLQLTLARDNAFVCRNNTGSTITKGQLVYVSGQQGNSRPTCALANANDVTKTPAAGATAEDISNNSDGYVIRFGQISGIDTSAFTEGDTLYVGTSTDGVFTRHLPTAPSLTQFAGTVLTSNAGNGKIQLSVVPATRHGAFISGSVPFSEGTGILQQDNTNLNFNDTTNELTATNLLFTRATGTSATTTNLAVTGSSQLGTVISGTWNGTAITDAYVADGLTISSSGSVDWTALTSYPTGCTNQFVRSIGDTLTCATVQNTDLANSTISGVSLGSNLNALTAGTGLSSAGTYTGAIARTFSVDQSFSPTWTGTHIFDLISRSTTTQATTTNLFSTTASSTNLFSANASFGILNIPNLSNGCLNITSGVVGSTGSACGAGGSGSPQWATTSPYGTQLVMYPVGQDNTDVVFGRTSGSTTTAPFWWDVSATTTYIGNGGTGGDSFLTLGPLSNEWTLGYDDTDKTFAIASSTALGTTNALTIAKNTLLTTLFGGLTINGTLSGVSGIDATTENTFEAALDSLLGLSSITVSTTATLPFGTSCDSNADGEICHDTSDNQLIVDGNAIPTTSVPIWGVTVASTSPAFISGGLLPVPTKLDGYTITRIQCHVTTGTSKVIAVEDGGANSSEDITCATTNTTDDGSITNATYTASELSFIDFGATSGSVDYVTISVFGNWTRE